MHIYHPPPPPENAKRTDQALTALFHWWSMRLTHILKDAPGPVGDRWLTEGIQEILCMSATEIRERLQTSEGSQNLPP